MSNGAGFGASSKKVGAQTWLYDMDMAFAQQCRDGLLGATQAGKTSLMRIMAAGRAHGAAGAGGWATYRHAGA